MTDCIETVETDYINNVNMNKNRIIIILFFLVGIIGFAVQVQAATTYYVDATNGADGTGGHDGTSEEKAWKTLSYVNAKMDDATIKAGDSVLFKRGETFAGYLEVRVTGTPGNILTFGAYDGTGAKPIINASGNSRAFTIENKSFITVENLDVRNGSQAQFFLRKGSSNITIDNCVTSGNSEQGGVWFYDLNFSNVSITNSTLSGLTYGITMGGAGGETFTNITIDHVTASSGICGVYLISGGSVTTMNISNSTFSNNSSNGIFLNNSSVTGLTISNCTTSSNSSFGTRIGGTISNVTIDNLTSDSNNNSGLYINTTSASNITIENSEFNSDTGEGQSGLALAGTGGNCQITSVTTYNNAGDGFNIHGNWTDVTLESCTADSNGTSHATADGDGFSFHDYCTGTIRRCISKNNLKSAIAHVGHAQVTMENNLFSCTTMGSLGALVYLEADGTYYLYNNVMYSAEQSGDVLEDAGSPPDHPATITAKNNIIYGGYYGIVKRSVPFTEDYNLIYGAIEPCGGYYTTLGAHDIYPSFDPRFTNEDSLDFSLKSNSPCIDAGTDVNTPDTDYMGLERYDYPFINNTGGDTIDYYDIGAYEHVGINSGRTNTVGADHSIVYSTYPTTIATAVAFAVTPLTGTVDIIIDTWKHRRQLLQTMDRDS